MIRPALTSIQFFESLSWIDSRPPMETIEQYRRELFAKARCTAYRRLHLNRQRRKLIDQQPL